MSQFPRGSTQPSSGAQKPGKGMLDAGVAELLCERTWKQVAPMVVPVAQLRSSPADEFIERSVNRSVRQTDAETAHNLTLRAGELLQAGICSSFRAQDLATARVLGRATPSNRPCRLHIPDRACQATLPPPKPLTQVQLCHAVSKACRLLLEPSTANLPLAGCSARCCRAST